LTLPRALPFNLPEMSIAKQRKPPALMLLCLLMSFGASGASVPEFEQFDYPFDIKHFDLWRQDQDLCMAAQMLAASYRGERGARAAWNHALTADMITTQPVVHEFPRLLVHTTLIVGLRDRTALGHDQVNADTAVRLGDYPRLGRAAADTIPDVTLVEFEGVGHMPQLESTERYLNALDHALSPRRP
jgi:pimeloyl-ACP methyl ester carboxylesterase